ncbi:hypothetical protein RYH80_18125 [Halobaculum sp. MBLA0147]|uniref:hypothetical protein n=1 Tax=Halobaculum sp. MBLA0147 TaxID=3079934 RepID=UPI0035254B38
MATVNLATVSNDAQLDQSADLDELRSLLAEWDLGTGPADTTSFEILESPPQLRIFGYADFRPTTPSGPDSGEACVPDLPQFAEAIAPYLVEPLVVRTVVYEKLRHRPSAGQVRIMPDGTVVTEDLEHTGTTVGVPRAPQDLADRDSSFEMNAGLKVTILDPARDEEHTETGVKDVDTDYGSENTVTVTYLDDSTQTFEGPGVGITNVETPE